MKNETAILAGGCFWGMEDLFRKLPGVLDTTVGYAGGHFANPTYDDVKKGNTGHAEALKIVFDPERLPYRDLLAFFFRIHDPTTKDRQGNDIGASYRSAIFYADDAQKREAEWLISEIEASRKWPGRVVTELTFAAEFYPAEDYHQDYLQRYPDGYTCHFVRPAWAV